MFIDTHSKESMEKTLCDLLNVTEDELYVIISEIGSRAGDDYDIWKSGIRDFINQHRPSSLPDEILLFHLARRLQGTEDDVIARNLLDLLTTENAFSKVLKEHKVEFYKEDGHIETIYNGKNVDWEKCWNGNSSYMKSRLGYFKGREDHCFNGFAFKDLLYKNSYARNLSGVPEFIGQLIECLGCRELGHFFMEHSAYYCYEYKIPIDRVMFDDHDSYSTGMKQKYLIECVIERLRDYRYSNPRYMYDHENPVLKLADDDILPASYFVSKEIITGDMLR